MSNVRISKFKTKKNFKLKIKKDPIIAGIIRLISHNRVVDDKIAISFEEKRPRTKIATEPLTPISAIVIVGVIVIKKKINITERIASIKEIFIPKT